MGTLSLVPTPTGVEVLSIVLYAFLQSSVCIFAIAEKMYRKFWKSQKFSVHFVLNKNNSMNKKQTIQHCQTPNNMTAEQNLDPIDVLVYTYLKAHMNQKTKQAFPSVRLLANETKLDIRTVQKCLNHLENAGDIIVHRSKGRPNVYEFNPKSKNFEMFSYKFLYENDNLTADERAYLIVTQQYMYKNDNSGYGKLSLTNKELSERINLSESAISRRHKTLQEKGVLTISDEFQKDCNSGLSLQLKIFDLTAIKQDMLFVKEKVAEHDLQLKEHNERLLKLEKENDELRKTIKVLINDSKSKTNQITSEFTFE